MSADDEVRAASRKFYAALKSVVNGNAGPMADVWSQGSDVTTMHPIGGRQVGRNEVWGPRQQIAEIASNGTVVLGDQLLRVIGDVAYELGTERAEMTLGGNPVRAEVRVTNIYRREGGAWRMVHHHSDVAPEMLSRPGAESR